ncbi:MAG: hypothetical protein HXY21_07385 [Parvularculaceae bacterium]|nr:hypothetical protein [Parvularculaceae bacterium]
MSIQSNTSTDWQFGSYEADRNQQIKIAENRILLQAGSRTGVQQPGGNITVGYGWDMDVQSLSATLTNFAAAGITLTANEQTALEGYKSGSVVTFDVGGATVTRVPTQADVIAVWGNFTITDALATNLLNIVIETWEAGLSGALGAEDIGDSRERAALISLFYNTTAGTAASIENFAPTTIGLIEDNPSTPEDIILKRANIWYEIVYGTNALRANDTL